MIILYSGTNVTFDYIAYTVFTNYMSCENDYIDESNCGVVKKWDIYEDCLYNALVTNGNRNALLRM